MTLEHPPVPGKLPGELPKRPVSRRGFLKIAAGVGAAAGLAAVGGIAIPMISSDGEGANPNPDTQPLSGGNGTPTPDNDPTVTPDTDPTASPTATPEATKTPDAKTYPEGSYRPSADKLGFKMGVLMARNDYDKLTAEGLTQRLVGDQYNRLGVEGLNVRTFAPTRDARGIHFDFSRADKVVKYGKDNEMELLGQHLSWWRAEQVADWVKNIKDKAEADAVLVEVTEAPVKHFPEINKWNINEYGQRVSRVDIMQQKWGDGYLFRVAEIAKGINPNLEIYYNDFGNEVENDFSNRDYALMQEGAAKGLFDGINFQVSVRTRPVSTYDALVRNFSRFRRLKDGKFKIGVSEFGMDEAVFSSEEVADFGETVLRAVLAVGGEAFSVTGAYDGTLNKTFPNQGTLYDAKGNPLPVKDRLNQVLNAEVEKRG